MSDKKDIGLKIAYGMIVFEGEYVLRQCLESVYPYAEQILIAEGPVTYWQQQGVSTSRDKTNDIIDNFPDPDNKIKIIHGQFDEKDDQCRSYMEHLNPDIDYIWNLDSDEIYSSQDIENIIDLLKKEEYTSVGVHSRSFYGGLDRYITGFEEGVDNFLRIFKVTPGCTWETHRPPTIAYPENITKKHINSKDLYDAIGFQMYHYSYVFPKQVYKKINYYKAAVSKHVCIDNYFTEVFLPWMNAHYHNGISIKDVEAKYAGVHEFHPNYRDAAYTAKFTGRHPQCVIDSYDEIMKDIFDQYNHCVEAYPNIIKPIS